MHVKHTLALEWDRAVKITKQYSEPCTWKLKQSFKYPRWLQRLNTSFKVITRSPAVKDHQINSTFISTLSTLDVWHATPESFIEKRPAWQLCVTHSFCVWLGVTGHITSPPEEPLTPPRALLTFSESLNTLLSNTGEGSRTQPLMIYIFLFYLAAVLKFIC